MIKDRSFNVSFLISFTWHVLVILAVTIIVAPTIEKVHQYQEVNFLGPILEKTAFDLMAGGARRPAEISYRYSPLVVDRFSLDVRGPQKVLVDKTFPVFIEERFYFSLKGYFAETKTVPKDFFGEETAGYVKPEKADFAFIEGPAASRKILHRPSPPKLSRDVYRGAGDFTVKLKFYLSGEGMVERAEPVVSSGYPEADLACIRYLKSWQFAPVSMMKADKMQTGEVSITLKME